MPRLLPSASYYSIEFPINWEKYKSHPLGSMLLKDAKNEWSPLVDDWMSFKGKLDWKDLTPYEQSYLTHNGFAVPREYTKDEAIRTATRMIEAENALSQKYGVGISPLRIVKVTPIGKKVVWFDPRPEARKAMDAFDGLY